MAWMREGTLVFARLNAGSDWTRDFTPDQQDCAVFADKAIRAHSGHIARLTVISEQAARGGQKKTTTRTRTVAGQVAEVHETVETMLPDLDMIKWKLEKLEPTVYGSKATLNINVTDMTDTEATTDLVEQRMREIAEQLRPKAIEATSIPDPQE